MYTFVRKWYAKAVSSSVLLEKINNRLLDLSLSARGFNNFRNTTESGEKFFVEKYLSKLSPTLCVDIGANSGEYTQLLLEKTSTNVISFEPMPATFKTLAQNLCAYSDRCTLVNKGVGAKNESLILHYNEAQSTQASLAGEVNNIDYLQNDKTLSVEVVSLDDYCQRHKITHIDFIKVDTEGFEKEVLQGAEKTIRALKPKCIQLEYNWHQLFRKTSLHAFAEELEDYNVYQLTYNNMRKVDTKHPFSNIYLFSNFVFIRKDIDS